MPRRRARLLTLSALVLAVQIASLSPALTRAGAMAPPPTVGRTVAIPLHDLASGDGRLAVRDGTLRARSAVRTERRTVCAPIWFTATALTWEQREGGPVGVTLEAGDSRSSFGPARELEAEPSESPDPGTPEYHPERRGTGLAWTGGGRCIRFTLELPAGADLAAPKAVFVNTSGTAAGPGTGPRNEPPAGTAVGATGFLGVATAEASPLRPPIVTREGWGADPRYFNSGDPDCDAPYYATRVKMAYVHHTAGTNDYSPAESDDLVRGIYWYHTQQRGFCDIAYNFLVDKYGTIFEGRLGGMERPVIPGSQAGFNTSTFSVSTMGNWDDAAPPDVMVRAVQRLLAWRLDVAHLPANAWARMTSAGGSTTRYPEGTVVRLRIITGHRDTGLTACPGDGLYALLPSIRSAVSSLGWPKIVRPRASSPNMTIGGDPVRFLARATNEITWRVTVTDAAGAPYVTRYATGQFLDMPWDGLDSSGDPVPPGVYTAVLGGQDADGHTARPATLSFAVEAEPTPSPSPTG